MTLSDLFVAHRDPHGSLYCPKRRIRITSISVACGLLVAVGILLTACGTTDDAEPNISFKPFLFPVKFTATSSGFSVSGDRSLVTPLGQISIGANVRLPTPARESIRVIIRDQKRGMLGSDDIYDVKVGEGSFEAVTNGRTVVQVTTDRKVVIDVTDARVESIEFRRVAPVSLKESDDNIIGTIESRWSSHWQTLPFGYHPWSLTRSAYDDSMIGKWYGIGFIVFLARLIIATLLAIIELVLALASLIAAIFYVLFGETGRNVCYGFLVLVTTGLIFLFYLTGLPRNDYVFDYEDDGEYEDDD